MLMADYVLSPEREAMILLTPKYRLAERGRMKSKREKLTGMESEM